MPKTAEDLEKSRATRRKIKAELGCIPESIMRHVKADKSIDLMAQERSYQSLSLMANEPRAYMRQAFGASGMSVRRGALSRFSQSVGRVLLKLYTRRDDWVIDPFAGHNSRMELCWRAGRNYVGCDVSQKFHEANVKVLEILRSERSNQLLVEKFLGNWVDLFCCDSRHMPIEDGLGDFTITSPPYWDIEEYGDEPEQLGKQKTYEGFLDGVQEVAADNLRVLKPGAYCVWFVNDFRRKGVFHVYHRDLMNRMEEVGFEPWDICIVDFGGSFGASFASQIVERKMLPKRHEYALIFRKPELKEEGDG